MRKIGAVLTIVLSLAWTVALGQQCICRLEGAEVSVKNFPSVQSVVVEKANSTLDVREADISHTFAETGDWGSGEKRALGPYPLVGRRRAQLQITQLAPKVGIPTPITVKWYVRYHPDDAFFDPCRQENSTALCTTGFPPVGARLRPMLPASQGEILDEFYIMNASVSIAILDMSGRRVFWWSRTRAQYRARFAYSSSSTDERGTARAEDVDLRPERAYTRRVPASR